MTVVCVCVCVRALKAGKDDKDAKKSRAERFGLSIKETISDKKTKRAARFGIETNGLSASSSSASKSTSKMAATVDDETKKKRMAKFGLSEEETAKLSGPAKANASSKAKPVKGVRERGEIHLNFSSPCLSSPSPSMYFICMRERARIVIVGGS